MERKIGEIFEYNGEWYQCVVAIQGCRECSFRTQDYCTRHSECLSEVRSDGMSVIFKKLEKVGEPITVKGRTFQKLIVENYSCPNCVFYIQSKECYKNSYIDGPCYNNDIWVEIKQTKEDMEDKKLNLKPFSLELAKAGKPVCTRDGRKARIICFDRISGDDYYKIVACVTAFDGDFEEVLSYGIDGYIVDSQNPKDEDLMMLPEKKEGWVNVYKDGLLDTKSYNTKKEAFDKASPRDYVDTIKINWSE